MVTILHKVREPYVDDDTDESFQQWEVEIDGARYYYTESEIMQAIKDLPLQQ